MISIEQVLWSEFPWRDLINSDWHDHLRSDHHEDRLCIPEWLHYFCARWNYHVKGIPRNILIKSLQDLRSILLRIAEHCACSTPLMPADWRHLNKYLKQAPCIKQFKITKANAPLQYIFLGNKLDALLGEIAGSFAESLACVDSTRIKICNNKNCRWVFYDSSKNKSRKWCDYTCSNLMKVRKFRLQHKK